MKWTLEHTFMGFSWIGNTPIRARFFDFINDDSGEFIRVPVAEWDRWSDSSTPRHRDLDEYDNWLNAMERWDDDGFPNFFPNERYRWINDPVIAASRRRQKIVDAARSVM